MTEASGTDRVETIQRERMSPYKHADPWYERVLDPPRATRTDTDNNDRGYYGQGADTQGTNDDHTADDLFTLNSKGYEPWRIPASTEKRPRS